MERIPQEIVQETAQEVGLASLEDPRALAREFSGEQPFICSYLLLCGEDQFNQDERGLLNYIGLVVWKIMCKGSRKVEKVSLAALEEAEEKNWLEVSDLSRGRDDADFIHIIQLLVENHNQPDVLTYIVEALLENDPDEVELRRENIGIMFIYLKTVLDCLDQQE